MATLRAPDAAAHHESICAARDHVVEARHKVEQRAELGHALFAARRARRALQRRGRVRTKRVGRVQGRRWYAWREGCGC